MNGQCVNERNDFFRFFIPTGAANTEIFNPEYRNSVAKSLTRDSEKVNNQTKKEYSFLYTVFYYYTI